MIAIIALSFALTGTETGPAVETVVTLPETVIVAPAPRPAPMQWACNAPRALATDESMTVRLCLRVPATDVTLPGDALGLLK